MAPKQNKQSRLDFQPSSPEGLINRKYRSKFKVALQKEFANREQLIRIDIEAKTKREELQKLEQEAEQRLQPPSQINHAKYRGLCAREQVLLKTISSLAQRNTQLLKQFEDGEVPTEHYDALDRVVNFHDEAQTGIENRFSKLQAELASLQLQQAQRQGGRSLTERLRESEQRIYSNMGIDPHQQKAQYPHEQDAILVQGNTNVMGTPKTTSAPSSSNRSSMFVFGRDVSGVAGEFSGVPAQPFSKSAGPGIPPIAKPTRSKMNIPHMSTSFPKTPAHAAEKAPRSQYSNPSLTKRFNSFTLGSDATETDVFQADQSPSVTPGGVQLHEANDFSSAVDKRPGSSGISGEQPSATRPRYNVPEPRQMPKSMMPAHADMTTPTRQRKQPVTPTFGDGPSGRRQFGQQTPLSVNNSPPVVEKDPADLQLRALIEGSLVELDDINPDDPGMGAWLRDIVQTLFADYKQRNNRRYLRWVNAKDPHDSWCFRAFVIAVSKEPKWLQGLECTAACNACRSGMTPCMLIMNGMVVIVPRRVNIGDPVDYKARSTWVGDVNSSNGRPRGPRKKRVPNFLRGKNNVS